MQVMDVVVKEQNVMGQLQDVEIVQAIMCKCKGNCRNLHNNGVTCGRCEKHDSTTNDEEQAPEMLPLVTYSADAIDSSTDSYYDA